MSDIAVPIIQSVFSQYGFNIHFNSYCPHSKSFKLATAFKKDRFELINQRQHYLTVDGKPMDNADRKSLSTLDETERNEYLARNLFQEFEKSAQITTLRDKGQRIVYLCMVTSR